MYRYLVCSDIHRRIENFKYALKEASADGLDGIICAGDIEVDSSILIDLANEVGAKLYLVKGNCDSSNVAGFQEMITFNVSEKLTCLLTHGHKYQVKYDMDTLQYVAQYRKVDIAIYGHTHIYDDQKVGNIRYINPGALCGGYSKPSYVLLTIDGKNIDVLKRVIN